MNNDLKNSIDEIHEAFDDFMCSVAGTPEDLEVVDRLIEVLSNYKKVSKNLTKQHSK